MVLPDFQREWCIKMINKINKMEISMPFRSELTREYGINKDIIDIVKTPMDLSIVRERLENNLYNNIDEFGRDVRLIWGNTLKIFRKGSSVYAMAADLSNWFEKRFNNYPRNQVEEWFILFHKTRADLIDLVNTCPGRERLVEVVAEVVRSHSHSEKLNEFDEPTPSLQINEKPSHPSRPTHSQSIDMFPKIKKEKQRKPQIELFPDNRPTHQFSHEPKPSFKSTESRGYVSEPPRPKPKPKDTDAGKINLFDL